MLASSAIASIVYNFATKATFKSNVEPCTSAARVYTECALALVANGDWPERQYVVTPSRMINQKCSRVRY